MMPCTVRSIYRYARVVAFAATAVAPLLFADNAPAASPSAQASFASPDEAIAGLVGAVRSANTKAIIKVLGPGSERLVDSGDAVSDKNARDKFLAIYGAGSKQVTRDNGDILFALGADEWPFPIPVVKTGGRWRFDAKAGAQEIIDRRVGANELNTIDVCRAYVDAQREYASEDRDGDGYLEYAQQFMSDAGKRNGLYWPTRVGEEESPMGPLMVLAQAKGYKAEGSKPAPYYGYYYRILKGQGAHADGGAIDYVVRGHMIGGFALVAYPASYGSSGIMSFIVNYKGDVYQKNLGPKTSEIARKMTLFDPDPSWTKVP